MGGVSVVVAVHDRLELTQRCLRALTPHLDGVDHEVVVVDDGSADGTGTWLEAQHVAGALVAVHHSFERGRAAACNSGVAVASGDVVVLLRNDAQVLDGWLAPLLDACRDEHVGVAGSRLLQPNGRIHHGGYLLGEDDEGLVVLDVDHDLHVHDSHFVAGRREVPAVSGASLAVRRDVWVALGGLDEGYAGGHEDVDLCLRAAEHGLAVVHEPRSVAVHLGAASGAAGWTDEVGNLRRFRERWSGRLPAGRDPALPAA